MKAVIGNKPVWTKAVVSHLENICFHNNGVVLNRESDKFYQRVISGNYLPDTECRVLDFGSGTARQLELNKIDTDDYTGFDTSSAMIETAKEKFPEYTFIDKLPEEHFDIVISNDVLQHSRNIEEFKSTLEKMCTLGNRVIAHFWYDDETRYQEVEIHGQTYPELFISLDDLTKIVVDISSDFCIEYFSNEKPYKCAVIDINLISDEDISLSSDFGTDGVKE